MGGQNEAGGHRWRRRRGSETVLHIWALPGFAAGDSVTATFRPFLSISANLTSRLVMAASARLA